MAGALGRRGEIFDMDALLAIDARRRELTNEVESRVAEMRQGSKQIGPLKKQGDEDGVRAILDTNERLKEEIKTFESALGEAEHSCQTPRTTRPPTAPARRITASIAPGEKNPISASSPRRTTIWERHSEFWI